MGNDCFSLIRCFIPCFPAKQNTYHSASSELRVQRYGFFCKFAIPKNGDFYYSNGGVFCENMLSIYLYKT